MTNQEVKFLGDQKIQMLLKKYFDQIVLHLHHLQVNGWFVASGLVALKLSIATTQAGGHYELQ